MNVCKLLRANGARIVVFVSIIAMASSASAGAPRVLPEGKTPADARLAPPRYLNSYFPFTPPESIEEWEKRSEQLRRHVLVATGLWPMPEKTPLNAVIHGKVERDDYTVERVYFESAPGHFVSGSLYRPKGKSGPMPGILCPHGHFPNGRFYRATDAAIEQHIKIGAERTETAARAPLQARCVQLARMGCVVFQYDMLGDADSQQIPRPIAHGGRERPLTNDLPDAWTFFSPRAVARLQTIMGLQTYNSIRALDFLCSLDDVDAERIGVTGASGGGTQTFILGAIDPRPAVQFPAVMVSTAMQGGCTCENCSYLRIGAGNVDIAGLFAPKPMGMTTADDWTKEMDTKGFPELQTLYALLGKKEHVALFTVPQFPHGYNLPSRESMYAWMNKHLGLGHSEPIVERDFELLSIEEMTVWNDEHPRPEGGEAHERRLLKQMAEASDKALAALSSDEYRDVVRGALDSMIGWDSPSATAKAQSLISRDAYDEIAYLVADESTGSQLPAICIRPKEKNGRAVLWIDGKGKAGAFDDDGKPRVEVMRLVDAGVEVWTVDLLYQGEFLEDASAVVANREAPLGRGLACYTYGYNRPIFAQRVRDVLTLADAVRARGAESVDVIGVNGGGRWVAVALACGGKFDHAAVSTDGFRFAKIDNLFDADFLPGAVKYGDLPGLLGAIDSEAWLWIAEESEASMPLLRRAVGSSTERLTFAAPENGNAAAEAVEWILGKDA